MEFNEVVRAIYNADPFDTNEVPEIDTRPEITIRAYVITRLTREYIHNIFDRSPELHQQILKLIADDQFATRKYFTNESIRVDDQPNVSELGTLHWRYWYNGRTGMVGGTKTVLKKNIKDNLLSYMGRLHE